MRKRSELELIFAAHIDQADMPKYEIEYEFDPDRKFRFDFAWPDLRIAVEVDGGTWSGGRHARGQGIYNDCIKQNRAVIKGWTVLRLTSDMIRESTEGLDYLKALMNMRGWREYS